MKREMGQLVTALPAGAWAYRLNVEACALSIFFDRRWVATVPPEDVRLHMRTQALMFRPHSDVRAELARIAEQELGLELGIDARDAYGRMASEASAAFDAEVSARLAERAVPDMPGWYYYE